MTSLIGLILSTAIGIGFIISIFSHAPPAGPGSVVAPVGGVIGALSWQDQDHLLSVAQAHPRTWSKLVRGCQAGKRPAGAPAGTCATIETVDFAANG